MATPCAAVSARCASCPSRFGRPFCDLPDEALREFDRINRIVKYPRGSILFVEGQEPRGVYVVCSGRVKLMATSAEGKTLITQLVETGEALALSAVVSGRALVVTARAVEPCVVKFVPRDDFLRFLRANGDVCLRVAQHISRSYYTAHRLVRSIGLVGSVPERLACLLVDRAEREGIHSAGGVRIALRLTHEEIAQMIGSTRETVTRAFGRLRRDRIVERRGGDLLISDLDALADLANRT